MRRRHSAVALSLCLIVSITALAQAQGQPTSRPQVIVLEINIVETTTSGQNDIEKIEAGKNQLNRLIADGKARLVAGLQVRTRIGDTFVARTGQRVPIQTATLPTLRTTTDREQRDARESGQAQASVGVPQIAYENTGLVLEGVATAAGEGLVDIRLKIEMTGFDHSTGRLTPTFLQRTFSNAVRMKESETVMLMGLVQPAGGKLSLEQIASGVTTPAGGALVVLVTTKRVQ